MIRKGKKINYHAGIGVVLELHAIDAGRFGVDRVNVAHTSAIEEILIVHSADIHFSYLDLYLALVGVASGLLL